MMGHAGPQGVCQVVIVRVCNRSGFLVATNIKIQQSIGCVSTRFFGLLLSLFLVEEENNVGNVGNVAQSEKSPQKSQ